MNHNEFSECAMKTPSSFIRAILKVAESKDVISFAGGLPSPVSFPQKEMNSSMNRVVAEHGSKVFQYSVTAGYGKLREYIAHKYNKMYAINISAEDVLITTGSQQALDLLGKIFINPGDGIIVEEPGYLGAIQAFSQYQPAFHPVRLDEDGINLEELEKALATGKMKFAYTVPNFQNPTGITYSSEKRSAVARLMEKYQVTLIEDDPYGELSFEGKKLGYMGTGNPQKSILLGTFSKTVTPGMRIGFLITKNKTYMKYLNTAKEASDLHSNIFSQYVIYDYLIHNDLESHIEQIKTLYRSQSSAMIEAMEAYFPKSIHFTRPQGGMFLWVTLPENRNTNILFEHALAMKVAFVPGNPFYTDGRDMNTMRLNYTNASKEEIWEGIRRLASVISRK